MLSLHTATRNAVGSLIWPCGYKAVLRIPKKHVLAFRINSHSILARSNNKGFVFKEKVHKYLLKKHHTHTRS